MRVLQAICNSNRTEFLHYAAEHSMKSDCHMGGEHSPAKLWPSPPPFSPARVSSPLGPTQHTILQFTIYV